MPRRGENIYKRKDGRWEFRVLSYYDDSGCAHYKSYYAPSYTKARQKKAELLSSQMPPIARPDAVCGPEHAQFETICRRWLAGIRPSIKESSYVKYKTVLNVHIIPALGNYTAAQIDAAVLEAFFTGLLAGGKKNGGGMAPKSVADIKSVVKQVLIYADRSGFGKTCSIDHIQIRQKQRGIRVLTGEDQAVLEKYLLDQSGLVCLGIYLCLYSGMRIGEICALRWEDIDPDAGTIFVNKTMQRIMDENSASGKKTKVVITSPKSACSIRRIPLPEFLHPMLKSRKQNYQNHAFVLTGLEEKFMEPRSMEYQFKKILRACSIPDINFHGIRHTFATRCAELNFDTKTLSEILGHANVSITLNRYVHPSMELKRSNMNKLGQLSAVRISGQRE